MGINNEEIIKTCVVLYVCKKGYEIEIKIVAGYAKIFLLYDEDSS